MDGQIDPPLPPEKTTFKKPSLIRDKQTWSFQPQVCLSLYDHFVERRRWSVYEKHWEVKVYLINQS